MTRSTAPAVEGRRNAEPGVARATMGLRWRLTLYLAVALVVLLVVFSLLSLQAAREARRLAFTQQVQLTRAIMVGLEREFDHVGSEARAHLPVVPPVSRATDVLAPLHTHLAGLGAQAYFQVTAIRLVDVGGEVLAAAPADTPGLQDTLPDRKTFSRAISEGATVVTQSRLTGVGAGPFAAVIVPLATPPGSSARAGLVVDTVGLAAIDLSSSAGETAPHEFEVLGPDGTVLTTSEAADELGTISYHYAAMKEFMAGKKAGAIVHRPGGGHPDHIAAIVPLRHAPFFLVTEEPLGVLLDWPQQLWDQALVLGAAAAAVILVLGWTIGRQIVRPVAQLRRATGRIKGGDLETPVRVQAKGELALLVDEVEEMRERLRETVSSLDGLNRGLADQVRARTRELRTVVGRLMQAQEDERHRIARDLHDETAQGLTALGVVLDEAAMESERQGREGLRSIREAREQVRRLVDDTRRLAYALRPSVLDDAGLVPALRWCTEAYLRPGDVEVSLHAPEPERRCAEPVEVALFRVGQEAMSNIARHARASHAWVSLERSGAWTTLTVRDDGVGFDVGQAMGEDGLSEVHGLGIAGMKERIDLLGGTLEVASRPGDGTSVTARVRTDGADEDGT